MYLYRKESLTLLKDIYNIIIYHGNTSRMVLVLVIIVSAASFKNLTHPYSTRFFVGFIASNHFSLQSKMCLPKLPKNYLSFFEVEVSSLREFIFLEFIIFKKI